MGIYIRLEPQPFFSPREQCLARFRFANVVWKAIEGWFYPKKVEIWCNTPLEQLDGVLLHEIPWQTSDSRTKIVEDVGGLLGKMSLDELLFSIITIEGMWRFDREFNGYMAVNNNPSWRKIYLDIEVDGYTHREDEDFADIVLTHKDAGEPFVKNFVEVVAMHTEEAVQLSAIYFFHGPVSKSEIFLAKALYYRSLKSLLRDMLASFKEELEEKKDKTTLLNLRPYKEDFLISRIMRNPQFRNKFPLILGEAGISEASSGSVLLIGKKKEAFQKAYKILCEEVFRPVAQKLPKSAQLEQYIDEALGSPQKRLNELTE